MVEGILQPRTENERKWKAGPFIPTKCRTQVAVYVDCRSFISVFSQPSDRTIHMCGGESVKCTMRSKRRNAE